MKRALFASTLQSESGEKQSHEPFCFPRLAHVRHGRSRSEMPNTDTIRPHPCLTDSLVLSKPHYHPYSTRVPILCVYQTISVSLSRVLFFGVLSFPQMFRPASETLS